MSEMNEVIDMQRTAAESAPPAAPTWRTARRAALAAGIGSTLEWYDLVTYGYLAALLGHAFFPSGDPTASLLAAFATFGVGFLARPLGGLLFGAYADRYGRKASLTLTMILMATVTGLVGIMPTYETWGTAAPALLVLARVIQGLSAGGEGTAALAYLVEWAPVGRRGVIGSLQSVASGCGLLLGSASVTWITHSLSAAELQAWGWRVPFLLGTLVGPIGYWLRRGVDETPAFRRAISAAPTADERMHNVQPWKLSVKAGIFLIFWSVAYYIFLTYMTTFAQRYLHLAPALVFKANTAALLLYIVLIPTFGFVSDKVGRKPVLLASCVGIAVLTYPLFKLLLAGVSTPAYVAILLLFSCMLAMYSGPAGATVAELFPTRIRSKWLGLGYGVSVAIFGGFTPFVATWLIGALGTPLAPTYYVIATAIIGGIFVLCLKETAKSELA